MKDDMIQALYTKFLIETSKNKLPRLPLEIYLLINFFQYQDFNVSKCNIINSVDKMNQNIILLKEIRERRNLKYQEWKQL